MVNQRDEISFRPLKFTIFIQEFCQSDQILPVKNPRLFNGKNNWEM